MTFKLYFLKGVVYLKYNNTLYTSEGNEFLYNFAENAGGNNALKVI